MGNIAVVYGTTEGHTRKICSEIARWLQEGGHVVHVLDSDCFPTDFDFGKPDAFILAGSLHEGHHQKSLSAFIKDHRDALSAKPSLFLSVSLSAIRKDDKHRADVQRCIDVFLADTEWTPLQTHPVAGALLYTQYSWMKRTLMRMISEKEGGDVDTSRDFEYTDWDDVRGVVENFCANARTQGFASSPV